MAHDLARLLGQRQNAPRIGEQALSGLGLATGIDLDRLWEAAELVDEHIGDEPVAPVAPRIAVRAAQQKLPVGLVGALDQQLRSQAAGDRLDGLSRQAAHAVPRAPRASHNPIDAQAIPAAS